MFHARSDEPQPFRHELPASGTGELSGVSGSAEIADQHDLVLDYSLSDPG